MPQPQPNITVNTTTVACDGGNDGLGHPRVFLKIGAEGQVECPYCSRVYVLDVKAVVHAH